MKQILTQMKSSHKNTATQKKLRFDQSLTTLFVLLCVHYFGCRSIVVDDVVVAVVVDVVVFINVVVVVVVVVDVDEDKEKKNHWIMIHCQVTK